MILKDKLVIHCSSSFEKDSEKGGYEKRILGIRQGYKKFRIDKGFLCCS